MPFYTELGEQGLRPGEPRRAGPNRALATQESLSQRPELAPRVGGNPVRSRFEQTGCR
jgi:hypothetical protein